MFANKYGAARRATAADFYVQGADGFAIAVFKDDHKHVTEAPNTRVRDDGSLAPAEVGPRFHWPKL